MPLFPRPDPQLPHYTPLPSSSSSSSAPSSSSSNGEKPHERRRWHPFSRRRLLVLVCVLVGLGLGVVGMSGERGRGRGWGRMTEWAGVGVRRRESVRGPPTLNYTDNLLPDLQYITSWIGGAGWTNEVFALVHLLHLALLTQRIPILPPFPPMPGRVSPDAGCLAFGDVFDVERLGEELGTAVLEWRDVKRGGEREEVGCWSTWMVSGGVEEGGKARESPLPAYLGLDISYTAVPSDAKMYPGPDYHLNIHRLLALSFPTARSSHLSSPSRHTLPSPITHASLDPDDHLMCFDYLYYVGVETSYEWEKDWSVQWRLVGRHLRWTREVEERANKSLRRLWGSEFRDPKKTPYIAVHVRRQDFTQYCPSHTQLCLASHAQIRRRVQEMQAALQTTKGAVTDRVLVTSDETDQEWWRVIGEMGYTRADHALLDTTTLYGNWYEPVLDSVFHSLAAAFVGTDGSTMSLLAEKRVADWNGGPVTRLVWGERYVKGGVPDADL